MTQDDGKKPIKFVSAAASIALLAVNLALVLSILREYVLPRQAFLVVFGVYTFIGIIRKYALRRRHSMLWSWSALLAALALPVAAVGFYLKPGPTLGLVAAAGAAAAWAAATGRASPWRSLIVVMLFSVLVGVASIGRFRSSGFADSCANAPLAPELTPVCPGIEHPYDTFPSPDGKYLFVTYGITGGLGRINLGAGEGEQGFKLLQTRISPQRIAFSPGTGLVYFPLWGRSKLAVVQAEAFESVRLVNLPGCGYAMDAAVFEPAGLLLVTCEATNNLFVLDAAELRIRAVIPLRFGLDSYAVAVDPERKVAFASDWMGPYLQVVDLDRLEPRARKWIGFSSFGVAVDPGRGLVFVARPLHSRVMVLDADTLEVGNAFRVGRGVRDIVVDAEAGLLFCGNYVDGSLDVIDYVAGRHVLGLEVGALLRGLSLDRDRRRLYTASKCGVGALDLEEFLPEYYPSEPGPGPAGP